LRILILITLFLAFPALALATDYQGSCSVIFQGSSTLHDFEGKGSCQPFHVSENVGIMIIPELSVAVSTMDTDNSKRDKKMRKMFNAENYPLIKGGIEPVSIADIRKALHENKEGHSEVVFLLQIRDIEKPVTATLQNIIEAEGQISADMTFAISLADYQLKPPSVLGIIRVGDNINVTTSLLLVAR
jgi:hypothetical protein